jgi:pimeloyl-ACP methyl ester carboxylesterase
MDLLLPEIARRLADGGFAVLRFDYRYFGASDGQPRNLLLPIHQVADARNALTFLQEQREVDENRVTLWGTSFGGGVAIYAGAQDERARAVIANVPVTNGRRWLRSINRADDWNRIQSALREDRVRRVLEGKMRAVPQTEFRPEDRSPAAERFRSEQGEALPRDTSRIFWRSVEAVIDFAPDEIAGHIAPRPLLIIGAPRDTITPIEEAESAYRVADSPKKLFYLPGDASHYDVYSGATMDAVIEESVAWLREYV